MCALLVQEAGSGSGPRRILHAEEPAHGCLDRRHRARVRSRGRDGRAVREEARHHTDDPIPTAEALRWARPEPGRRAAGGWNSASGFETEMISSYRPRFLGPNPCGSRAEIGTT